MSQSSQSKHKVFDNERFAPDGKTMTRDALSPGGTYFGKQTHASTPNKRNKAWQYEVLPSATAGEAAELHKGNEQSCRSARNKANHEDSTGTQLARLTHARAFLPVALVSVPFGFLLVIVCEGSKCCYPTIIAQFSSASRVLAPICGIAMTSSRPMSSCRGKSQT